MKKLLDRYYLVLMRTPWLISYRDSGIMSITITFNVISFYILLTPYLRTWNVDPDIFFFVSLSIFFMLYIFMEVRYNKKRREELMEKYKDESRKSRRRAVAWVWAYELFSLAFFYCSFLIGEWIMRY